MDNRLDQIEARLRAFFEDNLPALLTGNQSGAYLLKELAIVMQNNRKIYPSGEAFAPDQFTLFVSQDEFTHWENQSHWMHDMILWLRESAQAGRLGFLAPPSIAVHIDPNLDAPAFRWTAQFSDEAANLPDTAAMPSPEAFNPVDEIPNNAFLIIGGATNFPLDRNVINIGRHSDNDLVIPDQFASRHHAQLRAINHRYVIFDVGSSGGLILNGKRITQATLEPGDVIRIGESNLIYIQDTTAAQPTTAVPVSPDDQEWGDRP